MTTSVQAFSSRFDDVGALAESARRWDLNFTQIDRGRFDGGLFQLQWNGIQVQRAWFGRALEQHGSAPGQMQTFGIPATPDFSIIWRGHRVRGSDIMVFPASGDLYSVSQPGFDVFTFSASDRRLAEVAATAGLPWSGDACRGQVLRCEDDAMDRLRSLLERVTGRFGSSYGESSQPCAPEELGYELPRELLSTMSKGRAATAVPTSRLRRTALRRVERFITEHSDEVLRVSEVCRATGVSERTLRYAFQERFGIGPKAYLMARQLDLVQQALRRADPSSANIADIAGRFGFWHMGQFAADYRRHFGTLPSATLRGD